MIFSPVISVVMPVYNAEKYLNEAIQSILSQTYKDFEFIIINDGSNDKSLKIIEENKNIDNRIVIVNKKKSGIVDALNDGIAISRGRYIARMDADDISLKTRFEEQVQYMQKNNLDICGTWIQAFCNNNLLDTSRYPEKHDDIYFRLFFMSSFAHPSVMFKKEIFDKISYQKIVAEDYKLWCDAAANGYRLGNIQKNLLQYRIHDKQLTSLKKDENLKSSYIVSLEYSKSVNEKIYNITKKIFSEGITEYKVFKKILNDLVILSNAYGVGKENTHFIIKHIYNNLSYKNILFYFVYLTSTKGYNRKFKVEMKMLLKSTFFYRIIKKTKEKK